MADTRTDVLVAVYQDIDAAMKDFDGLMQIVKEKPVEIEGAILVTHDADGEVTVQHGDHLGRRGSAGAPARAWWSGYSRRRCSARWSSGPSPEG
jgi:hypothetical protein